MSINTNDLIGMYKSGKSVVQISEIVNIPVATIYHRINKTGFTIDRNGKGNELTKVPIHKITEMYESGSSENAISKHFGVSRNVIRHRLIKSGVHVRNQSEAEKLKWTKMNKQQRKKQVQSANDKIRSLPKSFHTKVSITQAIAKQKSLSKVGAFEQLFIDELKLRGFNPIPQKAVNVYNIDIAVNRTAIEIHVNGGNPESMPIYRKRIMKLLKLGWNVIYVKITRDVFIDRTTDNICRFINITESDKSGICQYRMIRGTGELVTTGCLNGDNLTTVSASD